MMHLAGEISQLIEAASGHCLVLFASYAAMSAMKERLLALNLMFPRFALDNNHPSHTVKQFKKQPDSVLLATGTAWEGMDFPGNCVFLLVIPKLSLCFPERTTGKQKQQYVSRQDFIQAVILPEMQLKLRKEFRRAICTETDTCVIAILDDRASRNGRYHDAMRKALSEMN